MKKLLILVAANRTKLALALFALAVASYFFFRGLTTWILLAVALALYFLPLEAIFLALAGKGGAA